MIKDYVLNNELEFDNEDFNLLLKNLNSYFKDQQKNFCQIAFCVYKISTYFDTHYIGREKKTQEYYDKYKLLAKFGFDKTAISRLSNCYLRFMTGTDERDINLKPWFEGFSPSKLFELLKLSDLTLESQIDKGLITPQMTVKEIREKIKLISNGKDKAEKVLEKIEEENYEEEIPPAYNPQKHYDFDYFKEKSKAQLLNMIWDLQKEYEKLLKGAKKQNEKQTNDRKSKR